MDFFGIVIVLLFVVKLFLGEYVILVLNFISFCMDVYLVSYNLGIFGKFFKKDEILRWVILSIIFLFFICLFMIFIVYCIVFSL